jgi:hypothetical protein
MLATGDAAGVVATLANADDVGSQLAGDALLLALTRGAAGAPAIAEGCAAALRARGWEGDEELATQVDAARGATAAATHLTEIPVDLEMLADVLEGGRDCAGGRLDLISREYGPRRCSPMSGPRTRTTWTTKSAGCTTGRSAYHDMIDFIATRSNSRVTARLEVAIDGRGAFGRFKRTLDSWPQDRIDWIEFGRRAPPRTGTLRAQRSDAPAGRGPRVPAVVKPKRRPVRRCYVASHVAPAP